MDGTMRIFERRFAIYMMLLIYKNPGKTKSWLVKYDNINYKTKYARLDELEDAGLIMIDEDKRISNTKLVYPTELGKKIGKKLWDIHEMIGLIECEMDEY